jgi:eukaryotic-like serine/threonine-protein kinase
VLTTPDVDDGAPVWDCPPGTELPGKHLAWQRLGVGHRCETWLAWSVPLWCPVVIKLARPSQLDQPRTVHSLTREVGALAGATHPALPRLLADGRSAQVPYLVVEYLDGPALDEELDNGPLSSQEVAQLAGPLVAALNHLHERGLAHIDVKPPNVILRDGRPVLIDFGSARPLDSPQARGRPIGSPGYSAPELEAGDPIAATMDMYGLGAVLYESLTGRPAFDPALPAARRPAPAPLPVGVQPALATTVMALLSPNPADRPAPADVLLTVARCSPDPDDRPWPQWADRYLTYRFRRPVEQPAAHPPAFGRDTWFTGLPEPEVRGVG